MVYEFALVVGALSAGFLLFRFVRRGRIGPIFPSVSEPFDPATGAFLAVDIAAQQKDLNLEESGRGRGRLGHPPASAKLPDAKEQQIENLVAGIARQARNSMTNFLKDARNRLQPQSGSQIADRIQDAEDDSTNTMYAEVRRTVNLLVERKRDSINADQWLDEFRERNELKRPSIFPNSHSFDLAQIAFLYVVESVANAMLFSDVVATGFIGSVSLWLAVSFINIASGFVIGFLLLRQLNHILFFRKSVSLIFVLGSLGWVGGWNLLVGHYRDALSSDADSLASLGQVAVDSILSVDWWRLDDFVSYMTVMIGWILSMIALWKGYNWDDPYPGYGKTQRAHDLKKEAYGRQFESAQKRLLAAEVNASLQIEEIVSSAQLYLKDASRIIRDIRDHQENYSAYMGQLEKDAMLLLQTYRDANREERSSQRVPPYWSKPFELSEEIKAFPKFEDWPEADMEAVQNASKVAHQNVDTNLKFFLMVYRTIDNLDAERIMGIDVEKLIERIMHSDRGKAFEVF
jgi:hypothetical protein